MYKVAGDKNLNFLDKLFPFDKKEWMGEKKVSEVLKNIGYKVMTGSKNLMTGIAIKQFRFKDCFSPKGSTFCHQLRMDFYLVTDKNKKIVIEYNGEQHYKSVESWGGDEGLKYRQDCDKAKADYCKQNGIRLIVIPYWDKNHIEEIITSQITPYNKLQESDFYIKNKNIVAKRIIRLTESDLIRLVKRVIKEDLNDYNVWDDIRKMDFQYLPDFEEYDITSENYDEIWDEIKGRTFGSFGDMGMYTDIITDYPVSNEANELLKKYPATEKFSTWDEWKNSEYYKETNNFFKPDRFKNENKVKTSFENYIKGFGDMIIKVAKDFNKKSIDYNKGPKLSPKEKKELYLKTLNKSAGFDVTTGLPNDE